MTKIISPNEQFPAIDDPTLDKMNMPRYPSTINFPVQTQLLKAMTTS